MKGETVLGKRVKFVFYGDGKKYSDRFFIKQKALELGLKGSCRLNSEKQLVVEVEGRSVSVDEFITFIQKGVSSHMGTTELSMEIFHTLKGYTTMESDIV